MAVPDDLLQRGSPEKEKSPYYRNIYIRELREKNNGPKSTDDLFASALQDLSVGDIIRAESGRVGGKTKKEGLP